MIMHSLMNFILLILTFMFTLMKHPLSMGLMLLLQTLTICLITGMMNNSFWFSYILFLVFLGGMLVLFIYVTSLASNELFNFSTKLFLIIFSLLIITFIVHYMMDSTQFMFINNNEMMELNFNFLNKENYIVIYKLYNYPTNLITLLLINYLLLTLIIVVKITDFYHGPLRNLN
uniref:NADH-ubiquinone oxidoreductase chain 6 n=1 Tax=Sciara ruficauda TaxID=1260812 RepID=A0A6G7GAZ6_9DIPT|nr:NADH dehydrogenase subunit 6 [Sciara ruficauda]QIH95761.1 NADH dehydrogenase subunit 6 [Sciara ruficauda]